MGPATGTSAACATRLRLRRVITPSVGITRHHGIEDGIDGQEPEASKPKASQADAVTFSSRASQGHSPISRQPRQQQSGGPDACLAALASGSPALGREAGDAAGRRDRTAGDRPSRLLVPACRREASGPCRAAP